MRHLVITAPDQLHCRMKGLSVTALVAEGRGCEPSRSADAVMAATKASLSSLAHRIQVLDDEIAELDEKIESLLLATAPELLARFGVGPDTAAALLVSRRQPRAPAFRGRLGPSVRGVADPGVVGQEHGPLSASIRGGDRQANSALWRIVMVRIAHDPETTAYFERKVKEGRSKRDVIRILEALRRPRGLSLPASRLNPRAVGLAHPLTVALRG
jgi:transposase